jgi:nicotinic acid mononucleotide adenylyltransferase
VRRVHRLAWRSHEGRHAREQVHDAYGKKDLAPAAQRTRMLELCLGSNSWVLTAATSAPERCPETAKPLNS